MRVRKKISLYILLIAGFFMLLSVVLPHHHHDDGTPCYKVLAMETSSGGHTNTEAHDCGCNGHNIAVFSSLQQHATDGDAHHFLMPLLTLFAYIYPPQPVVEGLLFGQKNAVYIESLHDTWISDASGLRAPPSLRFS